MGERRPALGHPLLPEAGRGDPVHPGDGAAAARHRGARRRRGRGHGRAPAGRPAGRGRRAASRPSTSCSAPSPRRSCSPARTTCRACRCSFTGTTGRRGRSRASTTTSRPSGRGTESRSARNARSPPGTASTFRTATGAELERPPTGRRCAASTRQRRPPRRHRLPRDAFFDVARADAGAPGGGHARLPRRPSPSPAPSTSRRGPTSTAATGAAWPTSRCSTSSFATTASSNARSRARCTRFEAGAQGEHKLKRGLVPAFTHSAHWIRHAGLADAIAGFVRSEANAVAEQARLYAEHSPFRADGDGDAPSR